MAQLDLRYAFCSKTRHARQSAHPESLIDPPSALSPESEQHVVGYHSRYYVTTSQLRQTLITINAEVIRAAPRLHAKRACHGDAKRNGNAVCPGETVWNLTC